MTSLSSSTRMPSSAARLFASGRAIAMMAAVLLAIVVASLTTATTALSLSLSLPHSHSAVSLTPGNITYDQLGGQPYIVDYDYRTFRINGERILLQSGSVHYPRSSPSMWPQIMASMRAAGLNTLQTYVFWNYHEAEKGVWDWTTESRNLGAFLQAAADAGLFVNLRLGPYVCAEWFWGGIPTWLHDQGFEFRSYTDGWMSAMTYYLRQVLAYVEPYLARNGGPVIIAQIENEYGVVMHDFRYVSWCANLTTQLDIGIPWIMCQQPDAPMNVVYACNGWDCASYVGNQQSARQQPAMWTENWDGWFGKFGQSRPARPVQNTAYSIARFIARGGSYHNYYMWHGGTHFGLHGGGPGFVASYDYDAPIDEFGVPHEPKFTHSANLHRALNTYSATIVSQNASAQVQIGNYTYSIVYGTLGQPGSVAFLINENVNVTITAVFDSNKFTLAPYSVQIVDGATLAVVYDSSVLPSESEWLSTRSEVAQLRPSAPTRAVDGRAEGTAAATSWFVEPVGVWSKDPIISLKPIDQLEATLYFTRYMWYTTIITLTQAQISAGSVVLELVQANDFEHIYLDDQLVATTYGAKNTSLTLSVANLQPGNHTLNILNVLQGMKNLSPFELNYGITSNVFLDSVKITENTWSHQVSTFGEFVQAYEPSSVEPRWISTGSAPVGAPLTWYRLEVPTPTVVGSFADSTWQLDLGGMGKGSAWVNGFQIGPFWNLTATTPACDVCTYEGSWNENRCRWGCGEASQSLYHVPRDVLQPAGGAPNVIVLFEELGGDVSTVVLSQRNHGGAGVVVNEAATKPSIASVDVNVIQM